MTVEAFVEGAASLGAVGTAGAALIIDTPRARARTMVAAMIFAAVALEPQVWPRLSDQVEGRPAIAAAGVVALALLVAALVLAIRRRPAWLGLLVFIALPFRVPLTIGGDTANLLVPLYVVILAGCLAMAFGREELPDAEAPKAVRRLDGALALVLILYAGQALYSSDLEHAVKNICFFYVPFALLYRLLRQVPWTRELLTRCLYVIVGLALFFAAIAFVEFATKHLLISNVKVLRANEIKPYFRVNSLFFDPNIYGRFLALTMVALATRLLWSGRARDNVLIAGALAVLWAGLVLSLSQSSFAALLVGLAVLAALRWKVWPVLAIAGVGIAVGVAVAVIAPKTLHLDGNGKSALDSATSGRADLVSGGWRMFVDRPAWGYGAGGFEQTYREREHVRSKRIAAISHTIPITVAAEQGAVGLAAYLALLVVALALLFGGLRAALRGAPEAPSALVQVRAVCAAAFCALLVHTLVYASFLEDPLTWVLLGLASAASLATEPSSS